MASDAVKKVQQKLFGGGNISNNDGLPRSEPALTINIPAVPSMPRPPAAAPPKSTEVSDPSPDNDELDARQQQDNCSYRERLASRIGADYKGVERYHLGQDERCERHWKRWGPYLSDRQWITRPTEMLGVIFLMNTRDLLLTIGAKTVLLEFLTIINAFASPSLWNGKDPILKERLFGVTGHQGNHGEDVKELYYYLDSTPSHLYVKFLYKYPQHRYPYKELYTKDEDEPDNVYIRITAYNRGPDPATLHIIPQPWFPNTWSWPLEKPLMPSLTAHNRSGINYITAKHPDQPKTHLYRLPSPPPVGPNGNFDVDPETEAVEPELLFTGNNTNFSRPYGGQNKTPYVEDAFHDHIIPSHRPPPHEGDEDFFSHKIRFRARVYSTAGSEVDDNEVEEGPCTPFPSGPDFVNPNKTGSKSAAHYIFRDVPSQGGCSVVRLKLTPLSVKKDLSIEDEGIFDDAVKAHRQEADKFYKFPRLWAYKQ
ncbi:hypothetical protein F5876DRAFT_61474 [Lentinula aff. lateritia]|uniref:Uncharacterized protein n=1 Tax=Lentinula aff. lateritia TaxID=2804960 RepID=A0ACC1UG75_9AGAR|nr:hypothetical protein F5876DRAFT_61474 [Lentinula aff. lateritia]